MAAASSPHRYPDWVMLDPHTRLNYPRPTLDYPEEHFLATHAHAETSKGDPVRVSFRAVPPPGASRLYVSWTPRSKRSSSSSSSPRRAEEDRWDGFDVPDPEIVAAHGNSILLQVTAHDQNRSDFFVYTMHPGGQPPSLQRLPRCDHRFQGVFDHMFTVTGDDDGVGLVCDVDTQEFVVADLIMLPKYDDKSDSQFDGDDDTPVVAGLCMLRSRGDWKSTEPRILHETGQGAELIWWHTDAVVPFGSSLCYVDYLRGVLFLDVLSEHPELRYVRLPVSIPYGDPENIETGLRGCPERSRSVCVTNGGGTMKFVEVVTTTVFVSFSRESVSSSFVVNVWRLRQDETMTWEKESTMDATQLWSLQGYGDLPRVAPTFPLVSMDEPDVIYLVLSNWPHHDDGGQTWIIVVDMLNTTLRSSSRYTRVYPNTNSFETDDGNMASANLTTNRAFIASDFSKYLHVPEKN